MKAAYLESYNKGKNTVSGFSKNDNKQQTTKSLNKSPGCATLIITAIILASVILCLV